MRTASLEEHIYADIDRSLQEHILHLHAKAAGPSGNEHEMDIAKYFRFRPNTKNSMKIVKSTWGSSFDNVLDLFWNVVKSNYMIQRLQGTVDVVLTSLEDLSFLSK